MRYQLSPECRKGINDYGYPHDVVQWLLNNSFDAELITPKIGTPDYKIVVPYNRSVRLAHFDVMPVDTLPEELFTL